MKSNEITKRERKEGIWPRLKTLVQGKEEEENAKQGK